MDIYTLDFEKPLAILHEQLEQLQQLTSNSGISMEDEQAALKHKIKETQQAIYAHLSPLQKIKLARHPSRPYTFDYIQAIFTDFQELHGDRCFGDDPAIIGGIAYFQAQPVLVLGHQKGRNLKEKLRCNFGSPNPEGYRKALRLMQLAERFSLPMISFIDTPGAYPGIGAEERHIGEAIAVNLREMSTLRIPIIAIVIGEGGSGGALGISIADRIFILENAYYSVISPEGCAAILWRDSAKVSEAIEALKLFAYDLKRLSVVDGIIKEPVGGVHTQPQFCINEIRTVLKKQLSALCAMPIEKLLEERYRKYRMMGVFEEAAA